MIDRGSGLAGDWTGRPGLILSFARGVRAWRLLAGVCAAAALAQAPASAETMSGALAHAYVNSPDINQQRANVRGIDENIPKAKAGWLPKVNATANVNWQYTYLRAAPTPITPTNPTRQRPAGVTYDNATPRGYGVQASETIFDGFKTLNSVRQAESQTFAAREQMRGTETNVLLSGATAYMDVLRDTAILGLRKNNISVLEEQLRQTRDRFQVGEVTRTDVAQAEASLAQSRSDFFAAQSALQHSIATYRQFIGVEPRSLAPAKSVEALLPKRMSEAVEVSQTEHPAIAAALHTVDSAMAAVKVAESALYPTASVVAQVNRSFDYQGQTGAKAFNAAVGGQINVPIYQGGAEYASIRQAKEALGQARLQADLQRDTVRSQLVTAWGQLQTAKAQIISGQAAVSAAEIALNGIREEAKVGQRTTFDVLTAQQTLLQTRVNLVTAQHDRVVSSYNVLAAMGWLSAARLNLTAQLYDPTIHFNQTKNRLFGISTPDGR
ncbi:MAG: TolC family outer membrane protein [Hyphomicrobiales bacterium]|nr:TolC family outer membrane protein [Hyphomicrobiales bacterium]